MFIARGEITATSAMHRSASGHCAQECETLDEAREAIGRWLSTDHERLDHSPEEPPAEVGERVGDGDWTYWIEENTNNA